MLLDSAHRRWALACAVLLVVAVLTYVPYARREVNGPSGDTASGLGYGIAGFALMLYAGVLGARRRVPMWRLGRASTWLRGHVWLGLLSVPLILMHGGFQLGGPLTTALMVLLALVVLSGGFGLFLQQFVPRMMTAQVQMETVYEEIDSVVAQLRDEADRVVAEACGRVPERGAAPGGRAGGGSPARELVSRPSGRREVTIPAPVPESAILEDLYGNEIRAFLDRRVPRASRLASPAEASSLWKQLRAALPVALHDRVDELAAICEERRQLARQKRLHHLLHGWLLVHVPLSMALLLLGAFHAVVALRY